MTDKPTTELDRLRRSELDFVRASQSLLEHVNIYDMPEDESRRWQNLADACLRAGAKL